jgi:hypothetical protein
MRKSCEVCSNFLSASRCEALRAEARDVTFGSRTVALCATHAHLVRAFRVSTLGGLRYLFQESGGRRSFVSRRDELGPAWATERRTQRGRRANDSVSD